MKLYLFVVVMLTVFLLTGCGTRNETTNNPKPSDQSRPSAAGPSSGREEPTNVKAEEDQEVAKVLRMLEGTDDVALLIRSLKHKNPEVRVQAAIILKDISPKADMAVPAFIDALNDDSRAVRWHAAEALGKFGSEARRAIPALKELLKDKNTELRHTAARTLWRIERNADSLVPLLIEDLQHKSGDDLHRASGILCEIGPAAEAAVPALVDILRKGPSQEHRQCAARVLGKIGPKAEPAIPALLEASEDKDFVWRDEAAKALKSIDPQGTLRLLDAGPKKRWRPLNHVGEVYAVAFSPDGKFLASATSTKRFLGRLL